MHETLQYEAAVKMHSDDACPKHCKRINIFRKMSILTSAPVTGIKELTGRNFDETRLELRSMLVL